MLDNYPLAHLAMDRIVETRSKTQRAQIPDPVLYEMISFDSVDKTSGLHDALAELKAAKIPYMLHVLEYAKNVRYALIYVDRSKAMDRIFVPHELRKEIKTDTSLKQSANMKIGFITTDIANVKPDMIEAKKDAYRKSKRDQAILHIPARHHDDFRALLRTIKFEQGDVAEYARRSAQYRTYRVPSAYLPALLPFLDRFTKEEQAHATDPFFLG